MKQSQLPGVLIPVLAQFDLELEAVEVVPAGKRQLLRVVVDGDGPSGTGPLLDELAEASQAVSAALDTSDVMGDAAYTLEVSSRGVSRPLERPAHWRRNRGRLVAVTTAEGNTLLGRIASADSETVQLEVDGALRVLAFCEVSKALVQVELNRPSPKVDTLDGEED